MSNLHLVTLQKNLNASPKALEKAIYKIYGKAAIKKFNINIKGIMTLNRFSLMLDENGVERLIKLIGTYKGDSSLMPVSITGSVPYMEDSECYIMINNHYILAVVCDTHLLVGYYGKASTEVYAGNVLHVLGEHFSSCVETLGVRGRNHYRVITEDDILDGDYLTRLQIEEELHRESVDDGFYNLDEDH